MHHSVRRRSTVPVIDEIEREAPVSADALYTAPLSTARALLTSRRHIDLARVASAGCR